MIALEFLLMVWDGFLILGRSAGVPEHKLRRFADLCWLATAVLCTLQLAVVITAGLSY